MLTGQAFFDHEYPMKNRLEDEGVQVENNQVVNFTHLFWQPIEPL
jgi:methylated-DNA-protein-cysteine methyltransferase-like protein